MTLRAAISGWGTAVPKQTLTNKDLESKVDTNDQWIVERTGISERRIAGPEDTTASLAVEAAEAAMKNADLTPSDISMLIVANTTPEQPIPHTGAFVSEAIGLNCGSFDVNTACAGFVYSLVIGSSMLTAGNLENVLVVGADTLTRFIDFTDRGTCILFGDGAAAVVLSKSDSAGPGLIAWDLGCDGSAAPLLHVPAGGSRKPATAQTVADGEHYLKMDGKEVFRRAVRVVVESAAITLERAALGASDIDWFIPHQANIRIIDAACERLGIPREKTVVNIEKYGNTTAASVPLALSEAAEDGRIKTGDKVLMSGFGAGMAWGTVIVEWGRP